MSPPQIHTFFKKVLQQKKALKMFNENEQGLKVGHTFF